MRVEYLGERQREERPFLEGNRVHGLFVENPRAWKFLMHYQNRCVDHLPVDIVDSAGHSMKVISLAVD